MKKHWGIGVVILLGVAIAALCLRNSPSYEGRSVNYWINELGGKDWVKAREALIEIGPDAVPALVNAHSSKSRLLDKAVGMLREHAPDVLANKLPERPDRSAIRNHSLETLVALGRDAERAMPRFQTAFLASDENGFEAMDLAESILAVTGKESPVACSFFVESLGSKDPEVVFASMLALGEIGPRARAAIPKLIELLNHESGRHRWRAAKTLGQIGPAATNAVPLLRKLMLDEKEYADARVGAAWALWRISSERDQTLPMLIQGLRGGGLWTDCNAAEALADIGSSAEPALPALRERLKATTLVGSGDYFKVKVAEAIWRISAKADAVLPSLVDLLLRSQKKEALHVLGELGAAARPAIPQLVVLLQDKENELRRSAANVLESIGPEAKEAVPALVNALDDEIVSVRLSAAEALSKIDPKNNELRAALSAWLKTGGVRTRRCAAELLDRIRRTPDAKAGSHR